MKISLLILLSIFSTAAFADIFVPSYQKRDGTNVPSHYRSEPNNIRNDNYSTQGNYNPYTGREGTKPRDNGFGSSY
jgi:hypothetical protein